MSWAKFDDQYPDHPKIVEVGPLGMALHTAATCYCARYLTDGFIPAAMMGRLMNFDGITVNGNAVTNKQVTDELTRVGLLEIVTGGYMVHDYLEYNPAGAQVKAERAANKKRQDEFREKRKSNGVSNGVTNPVPSPSPSPEEKEEERAFPLSPAGQWLSPEMEAQSIMQQVTGLAASPPDELTKYTRAILAIKDKHNGGHIDYLKGFYADWCARKTKAGKPYKRTALGWVEWALEGSSPKAPVEIRRRRKIDED